MSYFSSQKEKTVQSVDTPFVDQMKEVKTILKNEALMNEERLEQEVNWFYGYVKIYYIDRDQISAKCRKPLTLRSFKREIFILLRIEVHWSL
jgi:hypothetical protein